MHNSFAKMTLGLDSHRNSMPRVHGLSVESNKSYTNEMTNDFDYEVYVKTPKKV